MFKTSCCLSVETQREKNAYYSAARLASIAVIVYLLLNFKNAQSILEHFVEQYIDEFFLS